jgi:hypothetical protein
VYISPDDAKTDVILAAAVAVLGVSLRGFVVQLPLYPAPGLVSAVLDLGWILALTALVPWLLARYRGDGRAAFGWGSGGGFGPGLLIALPVVLIGVVGQLLAGGQGAVLLGRLAAPTGTAVGAIDAAIGAARVVVMSLGTLVLVGFLAVRAREGFTRSPEMHLTQLVRTTGFIAILVAGVGGLLGAIGPEPMRFVLALANAAALAGVVLLTDQAVPRGIHLPRAAIIAPVVVVVVGKVFATGGLFFGDLLSGLTTGALAIGVTLTIASAAQTRRGIGVAVPVVVAAHWWPTCLSPLVLAGGLC